jgi:protein-disulfide isomerase
MATSRSQTSRSRRAELERQRLEKEKHDRKMRLISFGGGGVVIVAVVVVLIVTLNLNKGGGSVKPLHADSNDSGIMLTENPVAGAPSLDLYTDFQCPACGEAEAKLSDTLKEIIEDGTAKVTFRSLKMLDTTNTTQNSRSSTRAAVAAACADTISGDYYFALLETIFQNQPAVEGDGWTDDQLGVVFPGQAGLAGEDLTKYQACYDKEETGQFVTSVDSAATKANVRSTPTYKLNGTTVTNDVLGAADPGAALKELIADATVS